MIRLLGALLFCLALALPAQAKMTLEQYRNYSAMPGGGTLVRSYLSGLRDGIVMLQQLLEERHDVRPTFCPGETDLLKGTRFEDMLQRELANPTRGEPWPEDMQMGRLVTLALQDAYPCRTY